MPAWMKELLDYLELTELEHPCDELAGSEYCDECKKSHPTWECWMALGMMRAGDE